MDLIRQFLSGTLLGGAVEGTPPDPGAADCALLAPRLARPHPTLAVYTDGAIRPADGRSGLAAVAWDGPRSICAIWAGCRPAMTNNEAEYAAACMALACLLPYRPARLTVYSDSLVLVEQMNGRAAARAPALRAAHASLHALAVRLGDVCFQHIPREHNRLADALANAVLDSDRRQPGRSLP